LLHDTTDRACAGPRSASWATHGANRSVLSYAEVG
jgi:hypothetical protein